jgi:hypothetical protein
VICQPAGRWCGGLVESRTFDRCADQQFYPNKISGRTPLFPNVSSGFFVPFPSAQNRKRTMKKPKDYTMSDKWPRRLIATDNHYLVHKIASVTIRDDILSFLFIHGDGRIYHGPCYLCANGKKPIAAKQLEANGLYDVSEIRFVIAYHWGAFPNGSPRRLLREFPCPQADEFATVIQRDNEKWRKRD